MTAEDVINNLKLTGIITSTLTAPQVLEEAGADSGIEDPYAVHFTPQTLTPEQQQQALENLGISGGGFSYEVLSELPASGQDGIIYLIGPTGSGTDQYAEYVWYNNSFVKIGDTSIDLSQYQPVLVSGENIKTINSQSILGSGNIDIQGGGSVDLPIYSGSGTSSLITNTELNTASGDYSHAEGTESKASAIASHAEGWSVTASGDYSHAEGQGTTASGQTSHAEGMGAKASGVASHAEGWSTIASGSGSHAEGVSATASGSYSHAEGSYTFAGGSGSHAEGAETTASGHYSHASGVSTTTNNEGEFATGRYNISHAPASGSTLFTVGVGYRDNDKNTYLNGIEILSNGLTFLRGVNGYNGDESTLVASCSLQAALKAIGVTVDDSILVIPNEGGGGGSGNGE